MKKIFYFLPVLFCFSLNAQQPYNWAKACGGVEFDVSLSITVDKFGNVYHTGYFFDTVDFDPGSAIFNLASHGGYDAYFAKYDNDGNFIWARSIGGSGNDFGTKIITDDIGNVYLCGRFSDTVDMDPGNGVNTSISNGLLDIFFAKFDSAGNYIWSKSMGGISSEECRTLSIDSDGNLSMAGAFVDGFDFDPGPASVILNNGGSSDVFMAKYDNEGNYIWARVIGGNSAFTTTVGMALDSQANMYVCGEFVGTMDFDAGPGTDIATATSLRDVYLIKYDSAGNYLWSKVLYGTGASISIGTDVIVNASGGVYICGNFQGTTDFDPGTGVANITASASGDGFFARYDSAGNFVYAKAIIGTGYEMPVRMATDALNNLYIVGAFDSIADFDPGVGTHYDTCAYFKDAFYAKYDGVGELQFVYSFGSVSDDAAQAVALDAAGNTFISGFFTNVVDFDPGIGVANLDAFGQLQNIFVAKYGDSVLPVNTTKMALKNHDILIYPNPVTEYLTISSACDIKSVAITDITGRLLLTTNKNKIQLTNLSNGIYLIHVFTDKGRYIERLKKE